MLRIDQSIIDTDKVICKNIECFDASERGFMSQNILSQLRNFVEYIMQKIHSNGEDIDPKNYDKKKEAWEFIKTHGQYSFLSRFHSLLQKSVSHYTCDEGSSERLMLKYYEYLLKIKIFLKNTYDLDVLMNIDDFPLNTDDGLVRYYDKIAERINKPSPNFSCNSFSDRSYIQKIKPFYVNNQIYYEVTFTIANDKASKFDRIIAFTNIEISDYYSVKLSIHNDLIEVMGKEMPIQVIDDWEVSIRPCEINNYGKIFSYNYKISAKNHEYLTLMKFLTESHMSLVDLVDSSDDYYNSIKSYCSEKVKSNHVFDLLDKSKCLIKKNEPGSNVLRYLLYKMNNKIIKLQYCNETCEKLSNLNLKWSCIPFDEMPFATSLVRHNPKIIDLLSCIDANGRKHEFLARKIKNNTDQHDMLFTAKKDLNQFDNIENLVQTYNSLLYYKHDDRKILDFKDYLYIKGYADDTFEIIKKLKKFASKGLQGYESFVESWLVKNKSYKIDSGEKLQALRTLFSNSLVAFIYGSAGTGKSTLINHISNVYNDKRKLYLANTNPAVDNLKRKVNAANCEFKTITKFLSSAHLVKEYDILVIDECSTVNNKDMLDILKKVKFKLLILAGDVFQIESILFGNWFSIARTFIPISSVVELKRPHRSNNSELLTVWKKVRDLRYDILESSVGSKFSSYLDESIFERSTDDEIVLCLNYDGLYGINNINRFLQSNNQNDPVEWGVNTYKIGDPILFNESNRFTPLLYNNMKGKIVDIKKDDSKIWFDIELDLAITEWDAEGYDFTLVGESKDKNSIIRFSVNKYKNTDEDDDDYKTIVPFQVAYAISIHKAQGLEYKSVKIVITNEVEELITHNIFYTAITRAVEHLKIYWSPETEKKIIKNFSLKNFRKDAKLLTLLYKL